MFKIIPVIDLYNDVVVHAQMGQREHYRPIQSQLTASAEPIAIITALLAVYPFEQLYIADLNAIMHHDNRHEQIIAEIQQAFPQLSIWLDRGASKADTLLQQPIQPLIEVIGTENIASLNDYRAIQKQGPEFCLSLDFLPDGYQGPEALLTSSQYWPDHVIAMTLTHVGSNQGVAMNVLNQILAKKKRHQQILAAGGVRNSMDLQNLKQMGVSGALVASALHHKQITGDDIARLQA